MYETFLSYQAINIYSARGERIATLEELENEAQ